MPLLAGKFLRFWVTAFDLAAQVIAARWLHSRAIEVFFPTVAVVYSGRLLFSTADFFSASPEYFVCQLALYNLTNGHLVIVLLLYTIIAFTGIWLNVHGSRYARRVRVVGTLFGCIFWAWAFWSLALNEGSIGLSSFCLVSAIFNVRLLGLAFANLPSSGDPWAKTPIKKGG